MSKLVELQVSDESKSMGTSGKNRLDEGVTQDVCCWLQATAEDLKGLNFEEPIAGSCAADCNEIMDHYRAASQALSGAPTVGDNPSARVWDMLWALTGLHFKPADVNEPFGPMLVRSNGERSAIPSDFEGHVDMLAEMATIASNRVLKARLLDVCWLLDRRKAALGTAAILTYLEIIRKIEAGELNFAFSSEDNGFRHETYEYLLRALCNWTNDWMEQA